MDKKLKILNITLDEKDGEFYYQGKSFKLVKTGDKFWCYDVFLDGNKMESITSINIFIQAGYGPEIRLEIMD